MTKEELFEKNTLMAYKIANKYRTNYQKEYEDIKQEALLGLWKACQGYDESRGCFSTYAYPCISNTINIYIRTLKKRQNRDISLFEPTTDNLSIEDSLGAEDENIELLEDRMVLDGIREKIDICYRDDRERNVFNLFLNGLKQNEIGNIVGASQPVVSRIERRVSKRINNLVTI